MISTAVRSLVAVLILALASLFAAPAVAGDKLTLRDGRVVEGSIVREEQGYVWIKTRIGGIEKEEIFEPHRIASIERASAKPAESPAVEAKPAADPSNEPAVRPALGGAPRAAVITLGEGSGKDMVGVYMTAEQLRRLIPLLKEENVEIVVFRINSGGGMLLEVQRLSDVIHNEYKPNFKVVSWIESAISAAAMTSHCIPEIYFMTKGNYGGATAFSGAGVAAKGRDLEEILYQMEKISARGGWPIEIARSMQIEEPLSVTIDEAGNATWYNNLQGEYVVNPANRVLTFNASDALRFKFSRGIADNVQDLGRAMGYSEVVWVGERVPGVPYPVSKAERENRAWRNRVAEAEERTREYQILYQQAIQMAQGAEGQTRGAFIAQAREQLEKIKRLVRDNPNFALLIFGATEEQFKRWVEEQEDLLRRLAAPPRR